MQQNMHSKKNIKALKEFNAWRRGADTDPPEEIGKLIDWAIEVCKAADNLVNVKGRHHSEIAYTYLEITLNSNG